MGLLDNMPWIRKSDNNSTVDGASLSESDTTQTTRQTSTTILSDTISNSKKAPTKTDNFQSNEDELPELTALREKHEESIIKLNDAHNTYEQIVIGTEPTLSPLKSDVDLKCEAYFRAVDESQNEEVRALRDEIKQTENSLFETTQNLAETEVVIQERTTTIAETASKITAKDLLIGSLAAKILEFQNQLNNTENEDSKISIRAKINQFQAQKGYEEAQKLTLETSKQSLEEQLAAEEEKKTQLEAKKAELEQKKQELDAKVIETKDKTVINALNSYNKAQELYQNEVEKLETQKSEALENIEKAQTALEIIEAEIAQKEAEILQKKLLAEAKKLAEAQKIANARQASGAGGADVGNASAIRGRDGAIHNQASREVSPDKLRNNVQKAKDDLSSKESLLYSIYDGTYKDLKKAKGTRDSSFEAFCKALAVGGNQDLANELRSDKKELDRLENDYYSKCKAVSQFESGIGASNASSTIVNQKITSLIQAKENIENADSTEEDATRKQELLSELNRELESLYAEKQGLEQSINGNERLNQLIEERNRAKVLYEEADSRLSEKISGIVDTNSDTPELARAKTAYDNAKNKYNTKFTSSIETVTGEITAAKSKVDNLSQTLGVAEGNELSAKYRYYSGGSIVGIAGKYIGLKESDGSADIFWQKVGVGCSSSSLPWCAAFVSSVLMEAGVDLTGAYKNSVYGLMNFAKNKGTFISGSDANAGNIKPGFAVFWKGGPFESHTGIVSQVYSDNTFDTIEGNSSNQVRACNRRYKMSQAAGFMAT